MRTSKHGRVNATTSLRAVTPDAKSSNAAQSLPEPGRFALSLAQACGVLPENNNVVTANNQSSKSVTAPWDAELTVRAYFDNTPRL